MPAKFTTRIVWPTKEEMEEAKAKAKERDMTLSKLVRDKLEEVPRLKHE